MQIEILITVRYGISKKGTYKVRNEIETKRNETKSMKTKRNETKRVREEYCNGQTCKMGFPVIINQNYCV
jgi:hypothetical protein